jgi:hypothetical protein
MNEVERYTQMGSGMISTHDGESGKAKGDWIKSTDYDALLARYRMIIDQCKPTVHMALGFDRYTLSFSKGIEIPIQCKTGPGLYDYKGVDETPSVDEAITAIVDANRPPPQSGRT